MVLPESRREDLVEEISSHIQVSSSEQPSEAEIRNVLDRLGTPEDIVDAELDDPQSPPALQTPAVAPTLREATVREPLSTGDVAGLVLLLLGGALLFPVGYLVGTALVGTSRRWSVLARVLLVGLPCVVALMVTVILVGSSLWYSPADLVDDPLGTLRGWLDLGLAAVPYTVVQVAALTAVWFLSRHARSASYR
jgi:uncharacterized membrane protein